MLLISAGEPLALLADDLVVLLVFFRAGEAPHLQCFGIKTDQRQRRTQFVRNVGNEIRFQSRQRHFFADVAVRQENSPASRSDRPPRIRKLVRTK